MVEISAGRINSCEEKVFAPHPLKVAVIWDEAIVVNIKTSSDVK